MNKKPLQKSALCKLVFTAMIFLLLPSCDAGSREEKRIAQLNRGLSEFAEKHTISYKVQASRVIGDNSDTLERQTAFLISKAAGINRVGYNFQR